jgi:Pvc16 N-terminal domain
MSNGLTIAAITAVFKNILEDGLVQSAALSSLGNILVTTLPPDQISIGVDGQPQLNLFLYQVSQNRNADLGGRDLNNSARQSSLGDENPPLAINLHYLLTAYGNKDFQTEMLLGYVMQLMHQTPILSNDAIRAALNHVATTNRTGLLSQAIESTSVAALTEQLDQVKISPNLFDTEQMSRLWSLLQSAYRPSIAYEVSMVFIDSQKYSAESGSSLQVLESGSSLQVLDRPNIDKVTASPSANSEIIAGSSLIIYGKKLSGDITRIRINEGKLLLEPQVIEDDRLLFKLPQNLYSGVHQIKVVHQQLYKYQNNQEVVSNDRTFVLHPTIKVSVQKQGSRDRDNSEATALTVQFSPKVGQQQQVIFRLTSTNGNDREVYTFHAPSRNVDEDTIQLLVTNVPAGSYLVQSEVDGIESFADIGQGDNNVVLKAKTSKAVCDD